MKIFTRVVKAEIEPTVRYSETGRTELRITSRIIYDTTQRR